MSDTQKRDVLIRAATKFTQIEQPESKDIITGIMIGIEMERAKWLEKMKTA